MKIFFQDSIPEIKISYSQGISLEESFKIKSSMNISEVIKQTWNMETIGLFEEFKVIFLNNRNIVKGIYTLSHGGYNGTVVDLRLIFALALKTASSGIALVHNHPSGACTPSEADKVITKRIVEVGKFHDINVLDHIIVTPYEGYFSFADEGLL